MLFWEHEANRAVRDGKWKLVAKSGQPWALYDIDQDRGEMHDLARREPERTEAMAAAWDAYAASGDVLPLGAWKKPTAAEKGNGKNASLSDAKRFDLKSGDAR
ncbi:MAG: hypothetical protein QM811_08565 [Pirellulales bacterium]